MLIQIRVCRDVNSLYCYVAANAPQCVGNEICSNLQDHGLHDKFVRKNEKSNRAWMTPCLTLVKAVPLEDVLTICIGLRVSFTRESTRDHDERFPRDHKAHFR